VFTQLHLDVHLSADFFPEPRARLEEYLRGAYLRYSLRREGGCYRMVAAGITAPQPETLKPET
jgi:hypothetical protein